MVSEKKARKKSKARKDVELKCVTAPEFAVFVGLTKQAVYKAIKEKRLENSVKELSDGSVVIEVMSGILEWFHKTKQDRTLNAKSFKSLKTISELPSEAESDQVIAFFRARQSEREDMESERKLVPVEEAKLELANVTSILKDRLLNLGAECSHEANPDNPDLARKVIDSKMNATLRNLSFEQLRSLGAE